MRLQTLSRFGAAVVTGAVSQQEWEQTMPTVPGCTVEHEGLVVFHFHGETPTTPHEPL